MRAKTKRDRQTDGQTDGGRCNISRPGPSAPREIKITVSFSYMGHNIQKCAFLAIRGALGGP